MRFTRQFRHYLLGRKFTLCTDHNSLTWLLGFRNIEGQLARWLEELSQYNVNVIHRPGVHHTNADGLSRIPDELPYCDCYMAGRRPTDLPCGGCQFCVRAHSQWSRFGDDVDDVVPLAIRTVTRLNNATDKRDLSADNLLNPPTGPIADAQVLAGQPSQGCSNTTWLGGHGAEEIQRMQEADPEIASLLRWRSMDKGPSQKELALSGPGAKHFWQCHKQLHPIGQVLYYRWE